MLTPQRPSTRHHQDRVRPSPRRQARPHTSAVGTSVPKLPQASAQELASDGHPVTPNTWFFSPASGHEAVRLTTRTDAASQDGASKNIAAESKDRSYDARSAAMAGEHLAPEAIVRAATAGTSGSKRRKRQQGDTVLDGVEFRPSTVETEALKFHAQLNGKRSQRPKSNVAKQGQKHVDEDRRGQANSNRVASRIALVTERVYQGIFGASSLVDVIISLQEEAKQAVHGGAARLLLVDCNVSSNANSSSPQRRSSGAEEQLSAGRNPAGDVKITHSPRGRPAAPKVVALSDASILKGLNGYSVTLDGVCRSCIRNGKPIYASKVSMDSEADVDPSLTSTVGGVVALPVRLPCSNSIIGVLRVVGPQSGMGLAAGDIEVLESIAMAAGPALQQASHSLLQEQCRKREEKLNDGLLQVGQQTSIDSAVVAAMSVVNASLPGYSTSVYILGSSSNNGDFNEAYTWVPRKSSSGPVQTARQGGGSSGELPTGGGESMRRRGVQLKGVCLSVLQTEYRKYTDSTPRERSRGSSSPDGRRPGSASPESRASTVMSRFGLTNVASPGQKFRTNKHNIAHFIAYGGEKNAPEGTTFHLGGVFAVVADNDGKPQGIIHVKPKTAFPGNSGTHMKKVTNLIDEEDSDDNSILLQVIRAAVQASVENEKDSSETAVNQRLAGNLSGSDARTVSCVAGALGSLLQVLRLGGGHRTLDKAVDKDMRNIKSKQVWEAMDQIASRCGAATDSGHCSVWLVRTQRLWSSVVGRAGSRRQMKSIGLSYWPLGTCAKQGISLTSSDNMPAEGSRQLKTLAKLTGIANLQGWAAVPVADSFGNVVAVVFMANRNMQPRLYSTAHISSTLSFCSSISPLLQLSREHSDLASESKRLQSLCDGCIGMLRTADDRRDVMQWLGRTTSQVLQAADVRIWTLDAGRQEVICTWATDPSVAGHGDAGSQRCKIPYGTGPAGYAALESNPIRTGRISEDARFNRQLEAGQGFTPADVKRVKRWIQDCQSMLIVPHTGKGVSSPFIVECMDKFNDSRDFSAFDQELLKSICSMAAAGFDVLSLRSLSARAQSQADNGSRITSFWSMLQSKISDATSIPHLVASMTPPLRNFLGCSSVALQIVVPGSGRMVTYTALDDIENFDPEVDNDVRVSCRFAPLRQGLSGSAMRSGVPIFSTDAFADPRYDPLTDMEPRLQTSANTASEDGPGRRKPMRSHLYLAGGHVVNNIMAVPVMLPGGVSSHQERDEGSGQVGTINLSAGHSLIAGAGQGSGGEGTAGAPGHESVASAGVLGCIIASKIDGMDVDNIKQEDFKLLQAMSPMLALQISSMRERAVVFAMHRLTNHLMNKPDTLAHLVHTQRAIAGAAMCRDARIWVVDTDSGCLWSACDELEATARLRSTDSDSSTSTTESASDSILSLMEENLSSSASSQMRIPKSCRVRSVKYGRGIASAAHKMSRTMAVNDVLNDPRHDAEADYLYVYEKVNNDDKHPSIFRKLAQTTIAVPLNLSYGGSDGSTIVVQAFDSRIGSFTEEDAQWLQLLGHSASTSLQMSSWRGRTDTIAKRLPLLTNAMKELMGSRTVDELLFKASALLRPILNARVSILMLVTREEGCRRWTSYKDSGVKENAVRAGLASEAMVKGQVVLSSIGRDMSSPISSSANQNKDLIPDLLIDVANDSSKPNSDKPLSPSGSPLGSPASIAALPVKVSPSGSMGAEERFRKVVSAAVVNALQEYRYVLAAEEEVERSTTNLQQVACPLLDSHKSVIGALEATSEPGGKALFLLTDTDFLAALADMLSCAILAVERRESAEEAERELAWRRERQQTAAARAASSMQRPGSSASSKNVLTMSVGGGNGSSGSSPQKRSHKLSTDSTTGSPRGTQPKPM